MLKNWKTSFSVLILFLAGILPAGEPFRKGTPDSRWKLTQYARWTATADGSTELEVHIAPDAPIRNETYGANLGIDLAPYKGKTIVISGLISADGIPQGEKSHCCAKLMLFHKGPEGSRYYSSSAGLWGTFRNRRQEIMLRVPDPVGENVLMAGLQNNRGTVRISGLRIEERDLYPLPFQLPENFRCEYTERVTKSPVLRGAGIRSDSTRKDAADLAAYGANLMRWWIRWDINQPETLQRSLDRLETMLPEYEKLGLKLIPVLAQVPGERYRKPLLLGVDAKEESGRSKDNFRMFFEKKYLDEYVAIWKTIAKRFKGSPAIHGYTLMNEPTQYGSAPYNYLYCQYLAAKAIREIDPEVPLYISANDWDNPIGFSYLKPLPFKNILYEVHMYQPHSYTHQGVGASIRDIRAGKYLRYPGKIGSDFYDRAMLRKILLPVVRFQKQYGARIYCGEFSVIRWAPGGAQYLEDLCSLFEEFGWDWAYHCHREWRNWSLEYPDSFHLNTPADSPTGRQKVLLKYWSKNR